MDLILFITRDWIILWTSEFEFLLNFINLRSWWRKLNLGITGKCRIHYFDSNIKLNTLSLNRRIIRWKAIRNKRRSLSKLDLGLTNLLNLMYFIYWRRGKRLPRRIEMESLVWDWKKVKLTNTKLATYYFDWVNLDVNSMLVWFLRIIVVNTVMIAQICYVF